MANRVNHLEYYYQQSFQNNDFKLSTSFDNILKRKKGSFASLQPITPSISHRFNAPGFNEQTKAKLDN
ncbi:hypothetical protein PS6_009515 [Mucor atramentarius]